MSQAQRVRFTPVLHQRLLSSGRQQRIKHDLRVPNEVLNAVSARFVDDDREKVASLIDAAGIGGDIKVNWECERKSYQMVAPKEYGGSFVLGRIVGPRTGIRGIMWWPKEMRNAILSPCYDQFDLRNALPNVIFHFFKDINLPSLEEAISAIDDVTDDAVRKQLKVMIARAIQCCPPRDPTPEQLDICQMEFWNGLVSEGKRIAACLSERYPGFEDLCRKKLEGEGRDPEQWAATAIQLFYDDVEFTIQCKAIDYLATILPELKTRTLICCDAIFVPRIHGEDLAIFTMKLSEAVRSGSLHGSNIGYRYVSSDSPGMGKEIISRVHDGVSVLDAVTEYEHWKIEWERDHFYLSGPDRWCTVHGKDVFQYKWRPFWESVYGHEIKVPKWQADRNRRTYVKMVNMPPPLECPPEYYNVWGMDNNFRAAELPELADDDNRTALIAPILEAFRVAVSRDEAAYRWLMCYIADMVQRPGIKRAQYVAFFGEQGMGKNELIERFLGDKIIGPKQFFAFNRLSEWADKYSDQWQNKMMIAVTEVEPSDIREHNGFLKGVMGSTHATVNVKCGVRYPLEFYGRAFLLTNHTNAIAEDNTKARRIGLRAVFSDLRQVPDLLDYLYSEKSQRAFFDHLMEVDLTGWDPERQRVDNEHLADVNFMTGFRKEPGNMMAVILHVSLDFLYERYRRTSADGSCFDPVFTVPQTAFLNPFVEMFGFEKRKGENGHSAHLSALAIKIDPTGENDIITKTKGRPSSVYRREVQGKWKRDNKPSWTINYPALKQRLAEFADKFNLEENFEIDVVRQSMHEAFDAYHQEVIESGLQYDPFTITSMIARPTLSARHNGAGKTPAYVIKRGQEVVFESDSLEEINKELGEAWVEETEDGLRLHDQHRNISTDFPGCKDKLMLELRFPFYSRSRIQT